MIRTQAYSLNFPSTTTRSLSIEKISASQEQYEKTLNNLQEWELIASKKKACCIPESEEEDRFYFSQILCSHVVTDLKSSLQPELDSRPDILKGSFQENELYICKDQENFLQGVMTISRLQIDEINITYLLTHPKNIVSSLNENSRIHGAGSSLLRHAIHLASEENKTQVTISAPNQTSTPFYKIYGFKPDPKMPCNLMYRMRELAQNK